MAAPFQLNIITPERTFFSGETTQLTVRTSAGDIGILANHFITRRQIDDECRTV